MNALNEQRKEAAAKLVIGHRFGRCVGVEGTDRRESNSRVFVFRCDCGCLFQRAINGIKRTLKHGWSPACPGCARNASRAASRPRRRPRADCETCAGLPHRRPEVGLCKCKLPFVPEPAIARASLGIGSQHWIGGRWL